MKTPIIIKREPGRDEITNEMKQQIEDVVKDLSESLEPFIGNIGLERKSKYEIMGHAGKLLSQISAGAFDKNIEAYVGFVVNTIKQEEVWIKEIQKSTIDKIYAGTEKLVNLKTRTTRRTFDKILRMVDYGVYYAIWKSHL
jgi:hypothetical protein